jgi:hypothetical protein
LVGRELQTALDTRASANFINGRIIKPQTRRRTTEQLAGEDSTITSTGSATLKVTIGDQTYIEEFLVIDQLSVDVILGDPWLRHAHVILTAYDAPITEPPSGPRRTGQADDFRRPE